MPINPSIWVFVEILREREGGDFDPETFGPAIHCALFEPVLQSVQSKSGHWYMVRPHLERGKPLTARVGKDTIVKKYREPGTIKSYTLCSAE